MDFKEKMILSHGFDSEFYLKDSKWRIAEFLYSQMSSDGKQRMPKKIHQIWLDGQLPDKYKEWAMSWKKYHSDWEYKLWTDEDVKDIEITSKKSFDTAQNPAMKSDILRYEILYKFGGLYVDTDFECLKPFDDLLHLNFFTGISYDAKLQLYNGLIASTPHHPVLKDCVGIEKTYTGSVGSKIINTTGANHFTKCVLSNITNKMVFFPPEYFYPFPNYLRNDTTQNPYDFVTDNSYAIHHWEVSWSNKNLKRHGLDTRR